MANFGIGIGSFMAGIERGKEAARAANAADAAAAQQQFQNNLATNADQRAGAESTDALATSKQKRDQNATNFQNQQQDYAANADLRKLQHDDKVSEITDANETDAINTAASADSDAAYNAAKARSIFVGKDAAGNPTYSVDGQAVPSQQAADELYDQTHANRMQTYYNVGGPKIVSDLLASGDTAGANAFIKAHQDLDFQRGVDSLGRLEGSYQTGDWNGVNENLNNILGNAGYINPANHEASATPIIGPDGTATGLTVHYKNKNTGEQVTKTFNTMADLHSGLHQYINPQAAVAYNQSLQDAQAALAAKAGEEAIKTKGQIAVGAALGEQNRLTDAAKAQLPETQAQRQIGVERVMGLIENGSGFPTVKGADGKDREMTQQEKWNQSAAAYDSDRLSSGANPASVPGASPFGGGAPILSSRPTPSVPSSPDDATSQGARRWWGGSQKSPAPVARGILDVQGPPKPPGPGSVNSYETSHNLANIPDLPPAPNYVPPMQQGQKAPMPAGGESADAFEQRLGLAPVPPQRNVVIDNTPQGRSVQQYADSLRLSAADQIAQDAKNKRLTKAQRGW